uniref:Uncharacterized protein n=1 Tax=viral metagenome TaxID=1070528 RepID=A0A6H1Z6X3_9ZZZZ
MATDKHTGKGGYVNGRWYDAIWTEKPKDDEYDFANKDTWDTDYYNPYDSSGKLKKGWNFHNTDISRGTYAHVLDQVADEDGNQLWVADSLPGHGYISGERPRSWQANVVDAIGSYVVPSFGVASGAAKVIKGLYQGKPASAIGGAIQAVASGYGMASSSGGGSTWGTGDTDPTTGQEILQGTQGSGGWGGGDTDPVTGQEILGQTDDAGNIDWTKLGTKLGKKYAKDYAMSALKKSMSGGGGEGGQQKPVNFSFDVADSPLSDLMDTSSDALDKIFEMTGETGDLGTATQAVQAFEAQALQGVELEKEIVKYKSDPDFKAIETELRAFTLDAVQQGMTPQKATAAAFEKAKKERVFREFIKDFNMRKKLEGAGLTGEQFDPDGTGYDSKAAKRFIDEQPLTIPKPTSYQGEYVTEPGAYQAWVWHPELSDYVLHSGSLDPETGRSLKGASHKTWNLSEQAEEERGNMLVYGEDGGYYSRPIPLR